MPRFILLIFTSLSLLGIVACQTPETLEPETGQPIVWQTEAADLNLPEGYTAVQLPLTFDRPTQFLIQENQLWVAQLAGRENEQQGEIIRVDLETGAKTIIAQGLDKPTGIALVDQTVWVATRDALLRIDTNASDPQPEGVLEGLPNNGRSNGTLTVMPSGEILYETSGNKKDSDSGKLWAIDAQTLAVREMATGFKGVYAHVVDDNGRVWLTEIADGSLDGVPYPDEVNLLKEGGNYGWPTCYGRDLQGTDCQNTEPALTIFGAGSTPTSIAVSPFEPDTLLVALWVFGEIVAVDMNTGEKRPFLSDLNNPQHLFHTDGALWFSDYATGKIYRISQE